MSVAAQLVGLSRYWIWENGEVARRIRRAKSGAAKIAKRKGLSISHVRDIKNGRRHKKTRGKK